MLNLVKKDNKVYKLESFFVSEEDSKNEKNKDCNDESYPVPVEGEPWSDKQQFLDKLKKVEKFLQKNTKIKKDRPTDCLLCNKKNISSGFYNIDDLIWEESLKHYIKKHNIQPSDEFKDVIYQFNYFKDKQTKIVKLNSHIYRVEDKKYFKLERNQIMIIDALMSHGGYTKKYLGVGKDKKPVYRYSEHAGLLDFDKLGLEKIIVSGKTKRVDHGDDDIFLPENMSDAFDYEYMFHTHPPTPIPGGRAKEGVLYEIPSVGDILHFIDHFNSGRTQGSIVVAPEGLYNIRKLDFDREKINFDKEKENAFYKKILHEQRKLQDKAIKKFGVKFTQETFYKKIAQDTEFIEDFNKVLNEYGIQVDYFPRIKDETGNWTIDTIHLPVYVTEKI